MKRFIDEQRGAYGVEQICNVLPIAPSTYRAHAAEAEARYYALMNDRPMAA
jgi:hypothetical protein